MNYKYIAKRAAIVYGIGLLGLVAYYFMTPDYEINWYSLPGLAKYSPSDMGGVAYEALVRLYGKDGRFHCSATVIDDKYILTAAHCVKGRHGYPTKELIHIYSINQEDTKTIAEAVAIDNVRDVALLRGNFAAFKHANLAYDSLPIGPLVVACGFPGGQRHTYCSQVSITGPAVFQLAAMGTLYPGMSGGPVVDIASGNVIGVNSASGYGSVFLAPIIGTFAEWNIEP